MPADVQLVEQHADSTPAPAVFLGEQYALAFASATVQVTEQNALIGAGSAALVSIVEQGALFANPVEGSGPVGAKASGSASWTPCYLHNSDGSGEWL